ncbi:MAG: SDR family oxidoreductase [Acidimicrobiia bacterium]|nr:SDR family oxidoreductase [Acidimicrobiia bacterium]
MTRRPNVILVTGASKGIGAATARLAAEAGDAVVINYRSDDAAASAVVADCTEGGGRAIAHRADVADEDAVVAMFDAAEQRFGPVDVLVNNAGILQQQMRLEDMTTDRWRMVFETNVFGAFVCAREAVRRMSTRFGGSGGSIVNVSSAASYIGSPEEYVDYAASKAALDTMTVGLGKEVATDGIRVVGVRPGIIHTGIHAVGGEPGRVDRVAPTIPMQRGGEPDEVARAILWLASDEASYITATMINISGGR